MHFKLINDLIFKCNYFCYYSLRDGLSRVYKVDLAPSEHQRGCGRSAELAWKVPARSPRSCCWVASGPRGSCWGTGWSAGGSWPVPSMKKVGTLASIFPLETAGKTSLPWRPTAGPPEALAASVTLPSPALRVSIAACSLPWLLLSERSVVVARKG